MAIGIISLIYPLFGLLIVLFKVIKNWNKTVEKSLKKYIFPLAMFFGVFGYSMAFSYNANDLSRYYDLIITFVDKSFRQIVLFDNEHLYVQDMLYYFVSRTGNVNIIAFITAFVVYSVVFYVLFDMIERFNKREYKVSDIFKLIIISVGIVSPYFIICNVRCILAFVIICFAVYREKVQKKKNLLTLLLYILPVLLHSSAIVIILMRVVSPIVKKVKKTSILFIVLIPKVIDFLYNLLKGKNFGFFTNVINKAYYYFNWNNGGWASQVQSYFSHTFIRITGTIFLIIVIIIILYYNKKTKNNELFDKPMIDFLYFSSIFALGTLYIKTGAFWRFESIVVLFSSVLFIQLLNNYRNFSSIINLIFLFSLLVFFANLVSMFRNIYFLETINNIITTSGLKILFELLKGIIFIF